MKKERTNTAAPKCSQIQGNEIHLLHVYCDNNHTMLVMQHIYRRIASVAVMSRANLFLIFIKKE